MVNCSIKGCKSRTEKKEPKISFHTFPLNTFQRNRWIACTGRLNWNPTKSSRICSKHFESSFVRHEKTRTFLNLRVVPTLFIHDQHTLTPPVSSISKCDNSEMDKNTKTLLIQPTQSTQSDKNTEKSKRIYLVSSQRKTKLAALSTRTWQVKKKIAILSAAMEELKGLRLKKN